MKKGYLYCLLPLFLSVLFIFTGNLIYILASILISLFIFIKKRNFKILMLSLFLTYILGLIHYLFFNFFYDRAFAITGWTIEAFTSNLKTSNFIPFKTIIEFINKFFIHSEDISTQVLILNLVGNFICFIPFALFIPYFFKKFKERKKFILLILLINLIIELLQFIGMCGSFDIDDIILNSSGCILFYLLFYNEINRFYDNYKIGNNSKDIIIFFSKVLLLVLIALCIVIIYNIREKKEKEYWDEYHFKSLEFLNYPVVCQSEKETYIYEDKYYKYYIKCDSPNKIELKINQTTVNLMDYLEGKTMYPIIIRRLQDAGMKMKEEEKYEKLVVCPKKISNPHYGAEDTLIVDMYQTTGVVQNKKDCKAFFIIPKTSGETNLVFEFPEETISYHIIIDDNKNIKIQLNE